MTASEARARVDKKKQELELGQRNSQYDAIISAIDQIVESESLYVYEAWVHGMHILPEVKRALEKDGYIVHDTIDDFKDGLITRIQW